MPKRMRTWNETKYRKFLAEGRGQGELSEYVPWVQIQDFPSKDEQGICIEYNAKELLAGISISLLPVCYDKKISYDAKTLAALGKAEMIFINFLVKDKVGIHGEDWHSQREWRIIAFSKNLALSKTEEKGKCIRIIKPTKIILGKHISYKVKSRIMNWIEKAGNENIGIVQRE